MIARAPLPLKEIQTECLQSLYTSNYESQHRRIPSPAPGTCLWFVQHDLYKTWSKKRGSSLLWLSADPGCGKSVLSSFLVNRFRESYSQTSLPGIVCYFFFAHGDTGQADATSALRALLHQLLEANPSLIPHAITKYASMGLKFRDDPDTLWGIFKRAATDPTSGNVTCVIDGLDECEQSTRSLLMRFFVDFYSCTEPTPNRGDGRLKIIVTSRPYRAIEDGFHDLPESRLKGENETKAISKDVELVVNTRVGELGSKRKLSDSVQEDLKKRLIKGELLP